MRLHRGVVMYCCGFSSTLCFLYIFFQKKSLEASACARVFAVRMTLVDRIVSKGYGGGAGRVETGIMIFDFSSHSNKK